MSKQVSVIIPTFNSAEYIEHALCAMLCQTYKNLEIIVVDDNSEDQTEDVVVKIAEQADNVQYHRLPYDDPQRFNARGVNINAGWMARNYGVERARGEYITFQDADDGARSNRIEVQVQLLEKYNAHHVAVDWQRFAENKNCTPLEYKLDDIDIVDSKEILRLASKTGRRFGGLFDLHSRENDSSLNKGAKKAGRQIFSVLDSYPCSGNHPLVKREVFEKVQFQPLGKRTRPSDRGRGADRDFNFAVAETFKDSIAARIPLVLWRQEHENQYYEENSLRF